MNFRELRKSMGPAWLTSGEGGLAGYALDLMRDALMQRVYLGALAGMPQNGPNGETAPEDALARMGQDRRVFRGINETAASYALRLTQWLVDRRAAGSAYALMKKLHEYTGTTHGCSFRTVDNRGNWFSRAADGTETASLNTGNWNWDGNTAARSRFWVIVYPGTLWTEGADSWGAVGAWGSAGPWGCDVTQEQVRTMQAIVADWKPDGTQCQNIILAFDDASFNPASPEPDGNWGGWSKVVSGVRVPSRLSTARYLDGRQSS